MSAMDLKANVGLITCMLCHLCATDSSESALIATPADLLVALSLSPLTFKAKSLFKLSRK